MKINKGIGALLIIISLVIGYWAFNKISASSESVKVLGLEIEASDESGKTEGYLVLGLSIILLGGGIYTINKADK